MSATAHTALMPTSSQARRVRTQPTSAAGTSATGTQPRTRVPPNGPADQPRRPPRASTRSRMFAKPLPAATPRGVEPAAVVGHVQLKPVTGAAQRDRHLAGARVLGRVLDGLQAAEVDRGLHVGGVPPHLLLDDGHPDRAGAERGPQRGPDAGLAEQRWVDAAGQADQGLDRRLGGGTLLGQDPLGPLRGPGLEGLGQPQVDREGHQVLLGSVVDVALQPPTFGVLGVHQPLPRDPQLLRPGRQLDQPSGELGPQPDPVQDQSGLPGETGEEPVLHGGQRLSLALLQPQHAQDLAGQAHRQGPPAGRRLLAGRGRIGLGGGRPGRGQDELVVDHQPDLRPAARRCRRRGPSPSAPAPRHSRRSR